MLIRIVSAAVGLPLLLAAVWLGDLFLALVGLIVTVLALREFYALARGAGGQPLARLGYFLGAGFFWGMGVIGPQGVPLFLVVAVIATLSGAMLRWQEGHTDAGWVWTLGGLLYVPLLLGHFLWLRMLYQGWEWTLLALLATFACDTGAYFTGRTVGRHKLAPRLSPGKTREGAVGGLVGAVLAVVILAEYYQLSVALPAALCLGLLVGVVAQVGDLAESYLKRTAHAKDAGTLIPGHGGLLDRLDSLVFVGPVVYYYAVWVLGAA